MEEYLSFAKGLALEAGEIMLEHFKVGVASHEKEDESIVTIADEKINRMVIEEVAKKYPGFSVFGEEESSNKNSEYVWVCDPIDGTVPYAKGMPVSAFSLALVKNGEPLIGVVYDPFTKRLYHAVKGQGAYLNDSKISVSSLELTRQATVNVEWWPEADYDIDTPLHELSKKNRIYVLHLGCFVTGACMVATGQYEACVYAGTKGKNIDVAAVKVIVEEAGGKVTNLFGEGQKYDRDIKGGILSNGTVHEDLVSLMKSSLP